MKPQKENVSFDELMKLDVRVCEILEVEKVEGSDKLYKLQIDTGIDKRTVVSAIAHQFTPEDLLDCNMPFVLNLEPRKIFGIKSEAMILMSEDTNKKLHCLDGTSPGSVVI